MKYVVEEANGFVKSNLELPLNFSVSGHYVVDIPTSLGVVFDGDVSPLIDAKNAAFLAQHGYMVDFLADEFLDASGVDTSPSVSSRFVTGTNKRVGLLPGGYLTTTVQTIPVDFTKLFFHCSVFTLTKQLESIGSDRPGPSRLLYNFDPNTEEFFDPAPIMNTYLYVSLTDSVGTPIMGLTNDSEVNYAQAGPFGFRLQFNNLTNSILYIADWIVLYG